MGIFGDGQRGRAAAKGYNFAAHEYLQELCDRCHAAWAKVEVITSAGSVFFCQHHHKQYRHSVIAAGHQIRAVLGRAVSGHRARELGAGGHAGLPEHLPQVVVDGGGAQEQLRGDVTVALAVADQPGDLRLLRRELVLGLRCPRAGALSGGQQLDPGPLGEGPGVHRGEHLVRGAELAARVAAAALAAQPFAVHQVSAGQLGLRPALL